MATAKTKEIELDVSQEDVLEWIATKIGLRNQIAEHEITAAMFAAKEKLSRRRALEQLRNQERLGVLKSDVRLINQHYVRVFWKNEL
jgi:hypothetical protein